MAGSSELVRRAERRRALVLVTVVVMLSVGLFAAVYLGMRFNRGPRNEAISRWFAWDEPEVQATARAELVSLFDAPCEGYPFRVPSRGFVAGLPYNAPYGPYNYANPHPGIDIFGLGNEGAIPIYAAYDGWLTRESGWVSSVIIRHDDPLHPGETIWTYYTHMANYTGTESYIAPEFPAGTYEEPVQQGDLLGYQGVYNGGPTSYDIAMHLHFSVVKSDRDGGYLNEAVFANTLDPSPYLGLNVNDANSPEYPVRCQPPPA